MSHSVVIFDLDGTLTRPYLDFNSIRAEIGCTGPILEALAGMNDADRRRAETILLRHEWDAAHNASLYDRAVELVTECRARGYQTAVLTRNARPIVDFLIERFGFAFDAIRTREDGAVKPSAEPVLSICAQLQVEPGRSWMVGDFLFDIQSGRAAGSRTVLMIGDQPPPPFADQADHVIRSLRELLPLISAA